MRKSVKVMAAAMAAMMALAGCGSKTAETTAADTKAAETTAEASTAETTAEAAGRRRKLHNRYFPVRRARLLR